VEQRKGQRYGSELRRQAVERMNACGNLVGLARELGPPREKFAAILRRHPLMRPRILHSWQGAGSHA
jgi:hypothetical protein